MSEYLKSLVFAALLCLVCSLLLTAAATGLKDRQLKNIEIDRHKNILKAFGLLADQRAYTPAEIEELYNSKVRKIAVNADGQVVKTPNDAAEQLTIYTHLENGHIQAYAVPINSNGLWGKINGYLALKSDGTTIIGFSVYSHNETPGLGGEIEADWFQKNFIGKKIISHDGNFVGITIAKGEVESMIPENQQINYVDGISGATLTGKFLSQGIQKDLRTIEPLSIQLRRNQPVNIEAN